MRTVTLVLLVAVLALPMASAETYRISGQATYSDNTPVMLRDVFVECRPGNVDCYQYRGASAITDAQGVYLIAIEVDEDEDGTEIYLQLRGENFTHVIDLDTFRNTSNGKMTQNLRLLKTVRARASSADWAAASCCLDSCSCRPCFEPCRVWPRHVDGPPSKATVSPSATTARCATRAWRSTTW